MSAPAITAEVLQSELVECVTKGSMHPNTARRIVAAFTANARLQRDYDEAVEACAIASNAFFMQGVHLDEPGITGRAACRCHSVVARSIARGSDT